jgi:hypothetical protein
MTSTSIASRVFLLSPAYLGGRRAELLLGGRGRFPLAARLRDGEPVPIGEAFAFLSGLYFRGKLAYATRFAEPVAGLPGARVITSNRGLLPLDTPVTTPELRAMGDTEIRADDPRYRDPLARDLEALDQAIPPEAPRPRVVLLGSVATGKYVDVLLAALGERLVFPAEFVGRGDMSRGGLLLRAAREGRELTYLPVATTVRRGPRPPRLEPHGGRDEPSPTPAGRR